MQIHQVTPKQKAEKASILVAEENAVLILVVVLKGKSQIGKKNETGNKRLD